MFKRGNSWHFRCCSHEQLGCPGFVYHGPGAGSFKHVSCWHWVVRSKVHVRWLGDLGVISLGPTGPKSLRIYQPYEWPEKPLHWDHGFSMVFLCFCLVPIIGCGHSPLRLWRRCSWRCGWRCCRWCCRWRWQLVVIVQWQLALWWTCGGSSPSSRGSLGALRDTWGQLCDMKVRVLPGRTRIFVFENVWIVSALVESQLTCSLICFSIPYKKQFHITYIYSFIYHMSIASWSITFDLKGMACFLVNLHL